MSNDDLERALIRFGVKKSDPIVADSAQPKDIEDMKRRGWNFIPAYKPTGVTKSNIAFIQQYNVHVTESSINLWKENENYAWALDQYKEPTDEPIDKWNHGMDAMGYGTDTLRKPGGIAIHSSVPTKTGNGRTIYNM